MKKLLIIGHARHGKDTLAELLSIHYGFKRESSSMKAAEIFIYKDLMSKYSYASPEECFEDRIHHRAEWHDLIAGYNKEDPAKLAKEILKTADIYVGMRSNREVKACIEQELFDLIIGIYDPRKPLEPKDSFDIDLWDASDLVIPNATSVYDLDEKILKLKWLLL